MSFEDERRRRSSVYDRRKTEPIVTFHPDNSEPTDGEFNDIFDYNNKSTPWFFLMLLLSSMPTFCLEAERAAQMISKNIEGNCIFPALLSNNWTMRMVLNFTVPKNAQYCMYLDFDYNEVLNQSYIEAMEKKLKMGKDLPKVKQCSLKLNQANYSWTRSNFLRTCASKKFKDSAETFRTLGEISSFLIGSVIADIWGRKMGLYVTYPPLVIGLILLLVAKHYYVLCTGYFLEGCGYASWSLLSYILFVEYCNPAVRGICLLFLSSFGILGKVFGYYIKYYTTSYFEANLFCSLPTIALIFYMYYVPESPRWYLSYGRKRQAWTFLENLHVDISEYSFLPRISLPKLRIFIDNMLLLFLTRKYLRAIIGIGLLLGIELILLEEKSVFVRIKQLRIPSHRMILLLGDIFSFFNTLPPFILFGRYVAIFLMHCTTILYLLASILITSITKWFVVNVLTVVALSSIHFVIHLYCCELMPTCSRATAVGLTWIIGHIFRFILRWIFYAIVGDQLLSPKNLEAYNYTLFAIGILGLGIIFIVPYYRVYHLPDFKRYRNIVET